MKKLQVSEVYVGREVIYWEIVKMNGDRYYPMRTKIRSDPWKLGHGDWVVNIEGKSGGVMVSHLEKVDEESIKYLREYEDANS